MKRSAFKFFNSKLHQHQRILFVTDTEGDTRSFYKTLQSSTMLDINPDKGLYFKSTIKEKPYFIYGGDLPDRGHGDLELAELLLQFKKEYPDQVFLLAGNRDITKNRIFIELNSFEIRERLLKTASPRWLTNNKTTPLDYVLESMKKIEFSGTPQEFVQSLSVKQCQLIYLHWMLEKTMGCPQTFEFRRTELSQRDSNQPVNDEVVLSSFIKECAPSGLFGQYLTHAQIGVIIPEAKLIAVHGGLHQDNIGRLPTMKPHENRIEEATAWIHQFNLWYQTQIAQWSNYSPSHTYIPACTALDECALPIAGQLKHVITSDYLDHQRQFKQIPYAISEYLEDNDLQIVLSGHQPCGDHPAIVKDGSLIFINGDTGYSNPQDPKNTRGCAFHCLELVTKEDHVRIELNAVLSNKNPVNTHLEVHKRFIKGNPYIGLITPDKELVQCQQEDELYRLAKQSGFKVEYRFVDTQEMQQLFPHVGRGLTLK